MKTIAKLLAAASVLLVTGLQTAAQVKPQLDPNEPSEEEFEPQALSLEWAVTQDYGYTLKGYPVENMMDDNPATAWAGGLDYIDEDGARVFDESRVYGDGILGFKIKVKGSRISYFTIIAGYAKSTVAYRNNSVPVEIAIYDGRCRLNDGGEFIDRSGNPAAPIAVKKLEKTMEPQTVDLYPGIGDNDTLWFVILDVQQGAKYNDLCISELTFYGRK